VSLSLQRENHPKGQCNDMFELDIERMNSIDYSNTTQEESCMTMGVVTRIAADVACIH
jgi:hypothetical protein